MSRRRTACLALLLASAAGPLLGQGSIDVEISDATVCEGPAGAEALFNVTVISNSPRPGAPVIIDYRTSDDTATGGQDFVAQPGGVLQFPDMMGPPQVQPVRVGILDDALLEGVAGEQFFVDLDSKDPRVIFKKQRGTGTILEDDATLAIAAPAASPEGDAGTTDAIFTVSLTPSSCRAVSVDAATRDATATIADGDYQPLQANLVFSPPPAPLAQVQQQLAVQVLGDTRLEGDEGFFVDAALPGGPSVTAAATILNDDTVTVSIGDAVFFEDDDGSSSVGVAVQLSEPAGLPVSVRFATRDGTANEDTDYRSTSGVVDFAPGETLQKVLVLVFGDTAIEPDEQFFIDLSDPQPAGAVIGDGEGLVIIRNDDVEGPGTLRLLSVPVVDEANVSAAITVERSGGANGPAAVELTTADGTATAGRDYRSRSRTLRWANGESGPKTVDVPILDDTEDEPDERFTVRLGNAVGAALGSPSSGEVVIRDDDQATMLEPVGETARGGRVEERLRFEALARRADGTPVAGAAVVWTAAGDAELVGEAETTTAADGVAGVDVVLGSRPGRATIGAAIPGTGESVRFEVEIEGDLDELFDPEANPEESAVSNLINAACRGPVPALGEVCDYLFDLEPGEQREVIAELLPREAGALADLLLRSPEAQLFNLRRHLAARRAGGGAGNQVTLSFGGQALPLGSLRLAISGRRVTEERLAAGIAAAMRRAAGEETDTPAAAAAEVDAESRLGFFASGQVDAGKRPGSEREAGFDLDTTGLTLGVDYRLGPRRILGGALGLVAMDAPITGDGGGTDVEGESLSLFFTSYGDRWWLDTILDYGRADFEISRNLDLPVAFAGQRRLVARAGPGGSRLAAELGGGYDAGLGATTVGLFGRLSYVDAELDAYTERGAGPFSLTIAAQKIESLLLEAGVELLYASSHSWGVLQPVLRASVLHELEDDSRVLNAGFAIDPGAGRFQIATDPPDRDYFRLGAGLTATFPRGRALYLNYDTDLERDDLDVSRLSGGLRLAF